VRTPFLLILLACAPLACNRGERPGEVEALRIWHSTDSSLEQRAQAAATLVPKGATIEQIRAALGPQGRPTHYHGPSFSSLSNGTNVPHSLPDHDYWTVNYEFTGGGVSLSLDSHDRFEWAGPYRLLETKPLTNKP
jgi:hypothetical protein